MPKAQYKMAHINHLRISDIQIAARRALINADAGYFSWSEQEQEIFRATKSERILQKIKVVVVNSLLNLRCDIKTVDAIWKELPNSDKDILNWAMLLADGVGEDFIFVNDSFAEDTTILNFNTLYDYDFDGYLFQEKSKKEQFPTYQSEDYYPFKWSPWIRLLVNDVFFYATLTSVASHIRGELEEFGDKYIEQLIPSKLVKGKSHGKPTKHGFQWDMKIVASGLEGQLEELKTRWLTYLEERWLAISQTQAAFEPLLYIEDDDSKQVTKRTFIFNNVGALKRVRWRHFLSDSQLLMAKNNHLQDLIGTEIMNGRAFLDDNYKNLIDNFAPKLLKLKQKRKVVMPSGLLDDLDNIDK